MRLRLHRQHIPRASLNSALDSVSAIAVLEGCRGSGKTTALLAWVSQTPNATFIPDAGADTAWDDIRAAATAPPQQAFVVIDQFERAPKDLPDRILGLVEEHPGTRVILAGRTVGVLGDRLVRVRYDIERIGPEFLALADDEIELMLGLRPAASDLELLRLPLLCLAAAALVEEEGLTVAAATRAAASAALAESLAGLDDGIVRAIQVIAVPDEIRDNLPAAGFSPRDYRDLLRELMQRGLGVCHAGSFTFAPSWRSALNDDYRETAPADYRQAHALAASRVADREHSVEALRHHLAAGHTDGADATVREFWFELALLRPEETLAALDHAGRASVSSSETLCALAAASAEALGDPYRAEVWWRSAIAEVTRAPALGSRRKEAPGRAWDAFIRARALRGLGHFDAAATAADEGIGVLEPRRLLPSRGSMIATMATEFALAFVHVGRLDQARPILLTAAALAPSGSPGWYSARSVSLAIEALSGNLISAQQQLDEVDRLLTDPPLASSSLGAWATLGRAIVLGDQGRSDEALTLLATAGSSPSDDVTPLLSAAVILIEHVRGNPEIPPLTFSSPDSPGRVSPLAHELTEWLRAWGLLASGGIAEARVIAADNAKRVVSVAVLRAAELRLTREPAEAFVLLAPLLSAVPEGTGERVLAAALALLAVTALELDEDAVATTAIRRLDALTHASGARLTGLLLREEDCELLAARLPNGAAVVNRMLLPKVGPTLELAERPVLSRAQRRVLGALAEEASLAAIALRLSLSRNTVKSHLRSIYRKLGADSREDALRRAARSGLLGWQTLES